MLTSLRLNKLEVWLVVMIKSGLVLVHCRSTCQRKNWRTKLTLSRDKESTRWKSGGARFQHQLSTPYVDWLFTTRSWFRPARVPKASGCWLIRMPLTNTKKFMYNDLKMLTGPPGRGKGAISSLFYDNRLTVLNNSVKIKKVYQTSVDDRQWV